jgi:hypothetical protein
VGLNLPQNLASVGEPVRIGGNKSNAESCGRGESLSNHPLVMEYLRNHDDMLFALSGPRAEAVKLFNPIHPRPP